MDCYQFQNTCHISLCLELGGIFLGSLTNLTKHRPYKSCPESLHRQQSKGTLAKHDVPVPDMGARTGKKTLQRAIKETTSSLNNNRRAG